MSDDNQIVIPPSFIALFVELGRSKPSATKEVIYDRYDFCEDMASMLTEQANAKLWDDRATRRKSVSKLGRNLKLGLCA